MALRKDGKPKRSSEIARQRNLTNHPRIGKTLPKKKCVNCGETKTVTKFPKRGGPYKKYKPTDPKRYDTQCKLCLKPVPEGQTRADLAEPVSRRPKRKKKNQW